MTLKLIDPSSHFMGENLPFWFVSLARVAGIFLMMTGLIYWLELLGVSGQSGLERELWYQAGMVVVLACSFLIASVGVWQVTFWGVVMWVLSSIAQTVAITLWDNFVVFQTILLTLHMIALVGLAASGGWIYVHAAQGKELA